MRDRKRGALIGLAVGDALGAPVEFCRPGAFEPVTGYRGGGAHNLLPGEWTDDTSMALALADSIVEVGWDLNDQARRYVAWKDWGEYSVNGRCFDIGGTTATALARFASGVDAWESGGVREGSCGNGSIMRLAPVAIHFAGATRREIMSRAEESSLPTHAHRIPVHACMALGLILAGLIRGETRQTALAPYGPWLGPVFSRLREVQNILRGSYRRKPPSRIRGTGYVLDSLEAALWAFHDAADFREAVLRAGNLGEDADTTGAVCGQLAGAYWGESGIPLEWRDGLARRDMIEKALASLGVGELDACG